MKVGLFLGAGASYEVGMPLVKEFSNILRCNLFKQLDSKLFNFNEDPSLKSYLIKLLNDESVNYEEVVGELENICIKNRVSSSSSNSVRVQLIECIQLLLLDEQRNTLSLLAEKLKNYYGFVDVVKAQGVLDVFSLNHDIVFEELCDYYSIPYRDGFFSSRHNYKKVANFKSISKEQLESGQLNFFQSGDSGVNIIKLHGSFDIFAVENKEQFLKSSGDGFNVGSNIREIRKIEEINRFIYRRDGTRIVNELCVYDDDNEIQFLSRSLLSGAHKFKNKFEQIAPVAFLKEFKKRLQTINNLVVVGYGFGDSHINEVLGSWISERSKSITIYDPCIKMVPGCLSHANDKVGIINGGISDFFLSANSTKENVFTQEKRKILRDVREKLKEKRLAQQT